MVKFRDAGENAAYEIAQGVSSAEEAAKHGLAVVEVDPTSGAPTAYGRYKNAPGKGPLGITVAQPGDTDVIAGGTASPNADHPAAGGKGSLESPGDPVIHGGSDEIHKDGAESPALDRSENKEQTAPPAKKK